MFRVKLWCLAVVAICLYLDTFWLLVLSQLSGSHNNNNNTHAYPSDP